VRYLLQAWKRLNYKDAVLILAGRDSTSDWVAGLIREYGGGNIRLMGWVKDVADFYNSISVLVQPSCSEGFGIEVLEAMSYSRLVICSDGAGAVDLLPRFCRFPATNVDELCSQIAYHKDNYEMNDFVSRWTSAYQSKASDHTWSKIRQR